MFYSLKNLYSRTHNNNKLYLDIAQFIFRFLLLSIIDFLKIFFGQKKSRFLLNILFYFWLLLSIGIFRFNVSTKLLIQKTYIIIIQIRSYLLFTIVLIFNLGELFCYDMIRSPINSQALSAINLHHFSREHLGYKYYFFFAVCFCFFANFLPLFRIFIEIPNLSFITSLFKHIFLFLFFISLVNNFHDSHNKELMDIKYTNYYYFSWLKRVLFDKIYIQPKVLQKSNKLKNLIILQLESYANENIKNPEIAPKMNNFSKIYEYIAPIYPVPYSTWTVGASILLQTGIPQIMPDTNWNIRENHKIDYILSIKGIPDILGSLGYKLHYATIGPNKIMGHNLWENARNFKRIYTAKDDLDLFSYITNIYLPKINKEIIDSDFSSHFMTVIQNAETHGPYKIPDWCHLDFPKIPEKRKCFYCIDALIGNLTQKYFELDMSEQSILVILPDHLPFSNDPIIGSVRELFFLFPGMKKVPINLKIKEQISYYDFAPTILNLIGIKDYVPEFPFGNDFYIHPNENITHHSLYNIKKHSKPDENDLTIIYKFLHYEIGKNIKSNLSQSNKFKCYTNYKKYQYFSDKPCNETYI